MKNRVLEIFDELFDIALFVFAWFCTVFTVIVLVTTAPIWIIPYTILKNLKHDGGDTQ